MQHAKDSFYIALRNRLTMINPKRVMILRGTERPGIIVEEAEAPVGEISNDVFVLRWTTTSFVESASSLIKMKCEVVYNTNGSANLSGLDRGRAMTEMDCELLSILNPMSTKKMDHTITPPVALGTYIFWDGAAFSDLTTMRGKLQRIASITVFSFIAAGEL